MRRHRGQGFISMGTPPLDCPPVPPRQRLLYQHTDILYKKKCHGVPSLEGAMTLGYNRAGATSATKRTHFSQYTYKLHDIQCYIFLYRSILPISQKHCYTCYTCYSREGKAIYIKGLKVVEGCNKKPKKCNKRNKRNKKAARKKSGGPVAPSKCNKKRPRSVTRPRALVALRGLCWAVMLGR